MSNLHTKLEQEVHDLKNKVINVENDINALKNKLDVWRNEANNMITAVKQDYINLDEDFIKLANYIKKLFTPLPDDLMKRIMSKKSVPMDKAARKSFLIKIKKINREFDEKEIQDCTECQQLREYDNTSTLVCSKHSCTDLDNLAEALNQQPPSPICGECGSKMIMDIATLNTIDWYCPKCCKKNPKSPLYEKSISWKEIADKAVKIREIYPDFNIYMGKFLEVSEEVISDNNFGEWDLYNIMKEAVELCNPDYEIPEEGFLDKLSNNTVKFMNECFDYIISDHELGEQIKKELEKE